MAHQSTALVDTTTPAASRTASALGKRAAVLAVVVLAGSLLGFIAVLPTLVAFVLAVAVAIAWCIWLERHPEAPVDGAEPPEVPVKP